MNGKSNFASIGVIEPMKVGESCFRELIEPGARLLEFEIIRDRAFARGFAGEIRVFSYEAVWRSVSASRTAAVIAS